MMILISILILIDVIQYWFNLSPTGEKGREDLNLSTLFARTVLSSRLFQSTIVRGKKLFLKEDGCLGGSAAKRRVFFLAERPTKLVVL